MGLFSRNNKKKIAEGESKDLEWSRDLKRNTASGETTSQQEFDFIENIDTDSVLDNFGTKKGLSLNVENISSDQVKILKNCQHENTAAELIKILKRTNKTKFKKTILNPLIDFGFFELTIPEKPTSPKQKYRLTGKFVKKRLKN